MNINHGRFRRVLTMVYSTQNYWVIQISSFWLSRCLHLRTETDQISETSCFYSLEFRKMEKVQKPGNSAINHGVRKILSINRIQSRAPLVKIYLRIISIPSTLRSPKRYIFLGFSNQTFYSLRVSPMSCISFLSYHIYLFVSQKMVMA
jgi:hypothetical protein